MPKFLHQMSARFILKIVLQEAQLLTCVMKCINIDLNECRIKKYLDLEGVLDQLTSGKQQTYNNEELASWFASLELRVFDTQTPIHEKLAQSHEQLAVISEALAQRDKQLTEILKSTKLAYNSAIKNFWETVKILI